MIDNAPEIVSRYMRAAEAKDAKAIAGCFAPDGTVLDEGVTYHGRDEIIGWRENAVSRWTYTLAVTGSQAVSPAEHRLSVHLEGDFPGGVADLTYDFAIHDGVITALRIVG